MIKMPCVLVTIVGLHACTVGWGCGTFDDDVAIEDIGVPMEPQFGPIGTNGMAPLDFWAPATQTALRTLGAGALAGEGGALVDTTLTDTAGGAEVLGYALRCALPGGTTVTSGGDTFDGAIGLAPDWRTRALTTSEQRWVTACLLQHLNGLGEEVPIMLDGSHPALDPVPREDTSAFTTEESTMFGNVFVTTPKAYACVELDLQLACLLDLGVLTAVLQSRICGASPTCGMTFLGLCKPLICADDASGDPSCTVLLLGPSYPQAIRSTIQDMDLLPLYPGCGLL